MTSLAPPVGPASAVPAQELQVVLHASAVAARAAAQPVAVPAVPAVPAAVPVRTDGLDLPRALRAVRQAVHYQCSRLAYLGVLGDIQHTQALPYLTAAPLRRACAEGSRTDRTEALERSRLLVGHRTVRRFFAVCLQQRTQNPAALFALYSTLQHFIGPHESAAEATRLLRRSMLGLHPDRTLHLQAAGAYRARQGRDDLLTLIEAVRELLANPYYSQILYAPERATYGSVSRGDVQSLAVAGLVGTLSGACLFLAKMGGTAPLIGAGCSLLLALWACSCFWHAAAR